MNNKKFIHFNSDSDYQDYKSDINRNSIVFVKDSKKIITHGSEYQYINWKVLEIPNPNFAGDYVLCNKSNYSIDIISKDSDISIYKDTHTPIGVVVIPNNHNVYGTYECGVMSLVEMCATSPTTGSSNQTQAENNQIYLVWSPSIDIEDLNNFRESIQTNNEDPEILTTHNCPFLPSDKFTGVECYTDPGTFYKENESWYSPSPYLRNGERNPSYHSTLFNSACSDLDGKSNSQILLNLRGQKDYSSWLPTWDNIDDYPAVSCCDMFCPIGTNQGDWYLPSMGELGYVMPRWNIINNSITNIRTVWGEEYAVMLKNDAYWTSTERSIESARHLSTGTGQIDTWGKKYHDFFVRAFTRIPTLV